MSGICPPNQEARTAHEFRDRARWVGWAFGQPPGDGLEVCRFLTSGRRTEFREPIHAVIFLLLASNT
jgi:hypothetical protein